MRKRSSYFSPHGKLSDKEIKEWIKKQKRTAKATEKTFHQFEKGERLAEKKSRETVIWRNNQAVFRKSGGNMKIRIFWQRFKKFMTTPSMVSFSPTYQYLPLWKSVLADWACFFSFGLWRPK